MIYIIYIYMIFNIWTCLIHIWNDDSRREMVQNFARTIALWVPDIYSVKSKTVSKT